MAVTKRYVEQPATVPEGVMHLVGAVDEGFPGTARRCGQRIRTGWNVAVIPEKHDMGTAVAFPNLAQLPAVGAVGDEIHRITNLHGRGFTRTSENARRPAPAAERRQQETVCVKVRHGRSER